MDYVMEGGSNMCIINEFAEKVLCTNESFVVIDNKRRRHHHFMSNNIGNAKCIYGVKSYDSNFVDLNSKAELVAIVRDETIYILDKCFFDIWSYNERTTTLPDNVIMFNTYVYMQNKRVKEEVFPRLYDELDVLMEYYEYSIDDIRQYKQDAREFMIYPHRSPKMSFPNVFTEKDVALHLCDMLSLDEKAKEFFKENKDIYIKCKARYAKIDEFIKGKVNIEDWELDIVKGLKLVDAKTVNVEFTFNGKTVTGKIEPGTIYRELCNRDDISDYSFVNKKQGSELLRSIGASRGGYGDSVLKYEHITKITYGAKLLYERK